MAFEKMLPFNQMSAHEQKSYFSFQIEALNPSF